MEFRVLGPLDVRIGDETIALGGGKQRAVLAVLLLRAGEVVSMERLVDEVWGDDPPPSAAHTLESYVSRLRQLFNGHGPLLVRRGAGYALEIGDATLDARGFVELQERAGLAAAMDEHHDVVDLTAAALAMWRGPALADVALASAGRAEADRLEELRLRTYELRFDAELALAQHERAIGELQTLVAQNQYRERFVAQLMLALYRAGRHAEALEVYEQTRRRLDEDLGLQPSTDLQQLSGRIVRQDPELRWLGAMQSSRPVAVMRSKARRLTELVIVGAGVAAVMAFTASGSTPRLPAVTQASAIGTSPIALVLPKDNPEPWVNPKLIRQVRSVAGSRSIETEVVLAASSPSEREIARIWDRLDDGDFGMAVVVGNALSKVVAPIAREVTGTHFVFLDASLTELSLVGAQNATGAPFRGEQTVELAGYLSGLAPRRDGFGKADMVSVVLGVRSPHAKRVARAFERGVRRSRPGVRVRVDYANEVNDPTTCELIANDQIDAGSDVVLAAAGSCGLGALAVARLRGVWGIGRYEDGAIEEDPHMLAATMKDWFRATGQLLTDYELRRLAAGKDEVFDLNDDYAVMIWVNSSVPESMWSKVTELCSKIRIRDRDESGHRNGMIEG
jgi:DNA-binding SARP family transcriptional activator/basic membrane lipoprotein Med (substrate-binding protein (PBP1-ABC) superfamily)